MYLNKVYLEKDCSESHWKRRFVEGIPRVLKDTVFLALHKEYQYQGPYMIIPSGELFSIVNLEGLALCNELKLENLKDKRKDARKQRFIL